MISQQDKPVRITERERTQENAFDEREDCRGGANAQSQGEDNCQGEPRRFLQLAKCEAEILCQRVHKSSLTLDSPVSRKQLCR